MKVNIKFEIPQELENLVEDFTEDHPHRNYHQDIECQGVINCLGEFFTYITNCFH